MAQYLAAVAVVPPGSIVYVCPGTYSEQVVISKNLTLRSESWVGKGSDDRANPLVGTVSTIADRCASSLWDRHLRFWTTRCVAFCLLRLCLLPVSLSVRSSS